MYHSSRRGHDLHRFTTYDYDEFESYVVRQDLIDVGLTAMSKHAFLTSRSLL